jgi:hypothetical protein
MRESVRRWQMGAAAPRSEHVGRNRAHVKQAELTTEVTEGLEEPSEIELTAPVAAAPPPANGIGAALEAASLSFTASPNVMPMCATSWSGVVTGNTSSVTVWDLRADGMIEGGEGTQAVSIQKEALNNANEKLHLALRNDQHTHINAFEYFSS